MRFRELLISLLLGLSVIVLHADEPLAKPTRYEIKSPSKQYIATIDPKTGVEVKAVGSSETLWKIPKLWSWGTFLADDGEHFVSCYEGLNLIPTNYSTNLVLITFWKKGQKIKDVAVGQMFPKTNVLVRTVSHYNWGYVEGIKDRTLTVHRCDQKKVKFDITTGEMQK